MVTALPLCRGLEDRIDVFGERIAEKHLLGEAGDEEHQPAREPLGRIRPLVGALVELVHDLAPAHERPGENLREEGDVEGVANEIVARRPAGLQIRQVHDVVEGEERDAERQRDVVVSARARPGTRFARSAKKLKYLKNAEDEQVAPRWPAGSAPVRPRLHETPRRRAS